MNENWTRSIKKCISFFGTDLTSAIIFAVKNKKNIRSNLKIKLNVDNGVVESFGFDITMDKNIPNDFYSTLKDINKPSENIVDFEFVYKQTFVKQKDDGVYAESTINYENFIFSFKIEKDNERAILFGKIETIMYYVPSNKTKIEVAPLIIELEVFDCIDDLINKNNENKDLILEIIKKQQLKNFLTKTITKYEDNSSIKYTRNMLTLDLTDMKDNSIKAKTLKKNL